MSVGTRWTDKALFFIRLTVLGLCMFTIFGGHHPPAFAQRTVAAVPVLTVEDAVQDTNIAELNSHLKATDERVQKQWEAINKNTNDQAASQAENRIIQFLIGIGVSSGVILQVKRKKDA